MYIAIKSPALIASGTKTTMNKTTIQVSLIATRLLVRPTCGKTQCKADQANARADYHADQYPSPE
jgi:hypothetical protein